MKTFDVYIIRQVDPEALNWPPSERASEDSGLGCNRVYQGLRGLTWREARDVLRIEEDLLKKIEMIDSQGMGIDEEFQDELYEVQGEYFLGLDLGVASTVFALSAARLIPFSSCNAGCIGESDHQEDHPIVAFYARPAWLPELLAVAEEAQVGLVNGYFGMALLHESASRVVLLLD